MANYSSDTDLALYLRESSSLPTLTDTHTEAKRRIDAYLRAKGLSADQIDDLGTTTLAQLKVASCYLVLSVFFDGFVGDEGAASAARRYEQLYAAQMSALYIEYSGGEEDGAEDTLTSGDCILG